MSHKRSDIFQFDIGNIRRGESVDIIVSYITKLAYDDKHIRFTIPQSIIPRYTTLTFDLLHIHTVHTYYTVLTLYTVTLAQQHTYIHNTYTHTVMVQ